MAALREKYPHSADLTNAPLDQPVETLEALQVPNEAPPAQPPASGAGPEVPPAAPAEPATAAPETPPAEPPPAEAAPATPPTPQDPPQGPSWKQVREAEKLAKQNERELLAERQRAMQLEQELALARARQAEQERIARGEQPQAYEPDPIEQMGQQLAQVQQQLARQQQDHQLTLQAQAFAREHADYEQAFQHYVQTERARAETSGELTAVATSLIHDPRGAQVVREAAVRNGITEAQAASNIAFELLYEQRRQTLVRGAELAGRPVPEVVYELAKLSGWQSPGANAAPAAAAAPAVPPELSAANRVRQEQTAAAASSVAGMTRAGTPPPVQVRSRQDLLRMGAKEREAYIDHMDSTQPGWDQALPD